MIAIFSMFSIHCNSCIKLWKVGKNAEKIKIRRFINEYKWEGRNFPSEKDDWTKFEKNNVTVVLDVTIVC